MYLCKLRPAFCIWQTFQALGNIFCCCCCCAVAALLLHLLPCRSNMQPIKMFLFMYIFCRGRQCKLQVARAGGKVSCFDMNVSFAHLSSLINIFQRSRALSSRLKSRHSALLSRFLLARPYPMSHASCAMCNVHPMCHQYLHQ